MGASIYIIMWLSGSLPRYIEMVCLVALASSIATMAVLRLGGYTAARSVSWMTYLLYAIIVVLVISHLYADRRLKSIMDGWNLEKERG